MNKKTLIITIVIIALILIALLCIFHKEKSDKVANIYEKINNSQNFTFSMQLVNNELKYEVSMAQRGVDVSIDMYSENEHNTTLVLNNEAYFIMHNKEEYYNYGDEQIDADIVLYGLKNIINSDYVSGREKIDGIEYYFEEYENESTDFIIYANVNEESKVKTRFYFDKDNICYIKNIIINNNKQEEELIKVKLSFEVDNNLFEIPDNYAEL